jgi:hypothetical protein
MRHRVAPLCAYRSDARRRLPPCAGSPPCSSAPPAPGTSSPPARRSCPRAPAAESFPAEARLAPAAATPSSRCDRTAAPNLLGCSRIAVPSPEAASPLPARSHVRKGATNDPAAPRRLRSSAISPLPPCRARVAAAPRPAYSRRSPRSDPPCLPSRPPRSAPAGRCQPARLTAGDGAAGGPLAIVPSGAPVDEIPVASAVRDSVCGRRELVFSAAGASRLGSPVGSIGYERISSFAARRISALITPRKSAPCGPNSSFATFQGSCGSGDGKRSGSASSGRALRRSSLQAMA